MNNCSWIKMGFKILKIIILGLLVVFALQSNVSNDKKVINKNYDFVQIVDLSASATKDEEEKPVEKPQVFKCRKS